MGRECGKLDMEGDKRETKGGESELNLELSIGGRYGKTENSKGGIRNFCEENVNGENLNSDISRSNFSSGVAENACEAVDLPRRKEIQAFRRQQARRKRGEKINKSREQNGVGFVEDNLFLETQKLQARVQEREIRERDCLSEEKARKKDKNCSNEGGDDLSLSLFTDNKISSQQTERDCLYPKVQQHLAPRNGFQYPYGVIPSWGHIVGEEEKNEAIMFCGNFGAYSSVDGDSEHSHGLNDRGNTKTVSNRSLERCSSVVSDYQSMSQKGGTSSDTGSHSSSLRPRQYHPGIAVDVESHYSSSQAETDQVLEGAKLAPLRNPQSNWRKPSEISKPEICLDQTNNSTSSMSENPSRKTSGSLNEKPPKPGNHNLNSAASVPKMPCVTATGNGPNGRTITGFLYKYTKTEVSIMCACHGSSFSPAEFVEHAGGVNISQPLKHITIVPTAFG